MMVSLLVSLKMLGGKMMSEQQEKEITFEKALSELEKVVQKLESGQLPLEEAIKYYEKGMNLSKTCDSILNNVSEKITHIMNEAGESESFEVQEE